VKIIKNWFGELLWLWKIQFCHRCTVRKWWVHMSIVSEKVNNFKFTERNIVIMKKYFGLKIVLQFHNQGTISLRLTSNIQTNFERYLLVVFQVQYFPHIVIHKISLQTS
jgi:hypothetical protein